MMGCRVFKNRHGRLTLRLFWRGRESWEGLGLTDTPDNRAEAERFARLVNAEIEAGTFTRERYLKLFPNGNRAAQVRAELGYIDAHKLGPTLRQYVTETWLPRRVVPMVRARYASVVRQHLDTYILDFKSQLGLLGDVPLARIEPAHLESLRVALVSRVSVKTARNIFATLSKVFSEAESLDRIVLRHPIRGAISWGGATGAATRKRAHINPLSEEERDKVLAYFRAHKEHYFPFVATLLLAGLRPSEATALRWGELDLDAGMLSVVRSRVGRKEAGPKTAKSLRHIRLQGPLIEILAAIPHELLPPDDAYVFTGRDGHPLVQENIQPRHWRPALKKLKLGNRRLYDCRHTFISLALSADANLKWLADYCGTSVAMIEKHYGKYMAPESVQLAKIEWRPGESRALDSGSRIESKKASNSTRRNG